MRDFFLTVLVFGLLLLQGALGESAYCAELDESIEREGKIRAASLYYLAKSASWKRDLSKISDDSFHICTIGESVINQEIEEVLGGKSIRRRKILLHHLRDGRSLGACNLLHIGEVSQEVENELEESLDMFPGFSVGQYRLGMVHLYEIRNKLRICLDSSALRRASISISEDLRHVSGVGDCTL